MHHLARLMRPTTPPIVAGSAAAVLALCLALPASVPLGAAGAPDPMPGQLRRGAVKALASGKLLVAGRNLPDPNFSRTVVLLIEFGQKGAVGVILNRQADYTLGRLVPRFEHAKGHAALPFFGGPVSPTAVLALLRSTWIRADTPHVVDDVYLVNTSTVLEELVTSGAGPEKFRVFFGYSGWGEQQLERETATGAWHVLDATGGVVFDRDPDSLWDREIKVAEGTSVELRPPHQEVPGPAVPAATCQVPGWVPKFPVRSRDSEISTGSSRASSGRQHRPGRETEHGT